VLGSVCVSSDYIRIVNQRILQAQNKLFYNSMKTNTFIFIYMLWGGSRLVIAVSKRITWGAMGKVSRSYSDHMKGGVWFCRATKVMWWCDMFGGGGSIYASAL